MQTIDKLIISINKKDRNIFTKLLLGVFLFPLLTFHSIIQAFYLVFASPYKSFQVTSKKKEDGTFKGCYQEHIKFKKKTRLFTLSSVSVVIVSVFAVNIISTIIFGYKLEPVYAASITWDGEGDTNDWSECANWSGDTCPGASDVATFDGTSTKNATIDSSFSGSVIGIDINSGYTGIITHDKVLTIGSSGYEQATGTFTGGSQGIDLNGNFTLTGGNFTSTSNTLSVSGAFTHTAGGTFNHNNGTFIADGGTVTYDFDSSENFYNFTLQKINNTDINLASGDRIMVANTLTLTDGRIDVGIIETWGDVTIASTADTGTATLQFRDTVDQNFSCARVDFINPIEINKSSGSVILGENFDYGGGQTFTLTDGTFNLNGYNFVLDSAYVQTGGTFTGGSGDIDFNGAFTLSGGTFTAPSGTMSLSYEFTHTDGGTFNHNNGTFIADGTTKAYNFNSSETFYNFTLQKNNNTDVDLGSGDKIIVLNTLTLTDGKIDVGTIEARKDVIVASTADNGTAILEFKETAEQNFSCAKIEFVNPIEINKSSGSVILGENFDYGGGQTFTLTSGTFNLNGYNFVLDSAYVQTGGTFTGGSGDFDLNNTFTLSGGIFTAPTGAMSVSGAYTHTAGGTFNHNNGTVVADGTIASINVSTSETFNNFTINKGSGTDLDIATGDTLIALGTLTLTDGEADGGTLEAQGDINIGSGYDSGYNTPLNIKGDAIQVMTFAASGNDKLNSNIVIDKSGGEVQLVAEAAFILDYSSQDLTVTEGILNANGEDITVSSGTFSVEDGGELKLDGDETITTPNLDMGSVVTYAGSSGPYTINNWDYFSLVIDSSGNIFNLGDSLMLANLTINNGIFHLNGEDLTVLNTFSNNDTVRLFGGEGISLTNDSDSGTWEYVGNGDDSPDSYNIFDSSFNNLIQDFTDDNDSLIFSGTPSTLDTNLQGYWTMDDASGSTVTDSSGNGLNAILTNMEAEDWQISDNCAPLSFTNDSCLLFGGSNESGVTANSPVLNYGSNFSISLWMKTATVGWKWLVSKNGGSWLGIDNTGKIVFTKAAGINYISTKTVTDNNWHNVITTFDNGTLDIYVDGTNFGHWTGVTLTTTTGAEHLGQRGDNSEYYVGYMDEVRFYDRTINNSEILSLADGDNTNEIMSTTTLNINNFLNISGGEFSAPATINLKGDFNYSGGIYTHNSNTVNLNDNSVSSTISGSNEFYNLSSTAAGKTINFTAGTTQTITNQLTLTGSEGSLINLRSTSPETAWNLDVSGSSSVSYVDVQDSDASSGNEIDPGVNSTNSGRNVNWLFNSAPSAPTTLYSNNTATTAQSGDANPGNLTDITPVFSAIYNDSDAGDIANKYCIEVDTASNFSGTDMWFSDSNSCNTGSSITNITAGNRSSDVEYAGDALACGTTYYWRVKFWDDHPVVGSWASGANFQINCAPTTSADSGSVDEDNTYNGDLSHGDGDGDSVTYSIVSDVSHGNLTLTDSATGTFTYEPAGNYNGSDSFTYKVNDGTEDSNTSTFTITVNSINDTPTFTGTLSNQSTSEDTNIISAFDLDGYFADVDTGDSCTYSTVNDFSLGTMTINDDNTVNFTLTANANGTDTVQFKCTDDSSASVNSNEVTVSISAVNDVPTFTGTLSNQSTSEDTNIISAFDLDGYFADVDTGDSCTYSTVNDFSLGTMTINDDNTVDFTLTANANGTDTVQFKCTDDSSASVNSNEVTVSVSAVNDVPVANFSGFSIDEDSEAGYLDGSDSSDIDGDSLTYAWTEISDSSDGCSISDNDVEQPNLTVSDRESSYSCIYRLTVNDGVVNSSSVEGTVNVTGENDPPAMISITDKIVQAGDELDFAVGANDIDTDDLSLALGDPESDFSTASINTDELFTDNGNKTGTFSWDTEVDQGGTYIASFTANDGDNSDVELINITVTEEEVEETNNAPVFSGSLDNIAFYGGTTTNVLFDLDDYFVDEDEDDTLTYYVSGDDKVEIIISEGQITMTAPKAFSGSEALVFSAIDEAGATTYSNAIIVSVSKLTESKVDHVNTSSKGKGIVTIIDKNNNTASSWQAFPKGGAIARVGTINNKSYVYVVKQQSGSTIHAYTLTGKIVKKQRLSPNLHWRRLASGNLDNNKKTEEIVVGTRRGKTIYFKIFSFQPKKKRFKILKRAKYSPVSKDFRLNIRKKKVVVIINGKGKIVKQWKPF